ncbi:MAG TPA: ribosome rescue protein RqcH, partial [Thermoplasmata archaeon]|nr:ribosome rescue protein RqcH [Thermoplasmata archaeon]
MKDGMSSFDVLAVTAELRALVGGFVDKAYQRGDELILKVNMPGAGRRETFAKVGKWLCLRDVPEKPETPPPFATTLRKHLDNARIVALEQRGFDRIVTFAFDRGMRLVFELFGKGNVILVGESGILAAFHRQTFRDRTVAPGAPYEYPPATSDPFGMSGEAFAAAVVSAKGTIVKILAGGMNLGGQYAEEVLLRAGVEKTAKIGDADDVRLARIHAVLLEIHRQVRDHPEPQVVFEGVAPVDVTPIPLNQHADRERKPFPTFSEALAFFLDHAPPPPTPADEATAKLRRRIEHQEATLRELREDAVRSGALAELVFAHFARFDELIREANEGRLEVGGAVIAVDPERHRARVAVGDAAEIEIDWTRDVQGNAQILYERRRDALEKAEKVAVAIEETQQQLQSAAKKAAKAVARPRVKATKSFWFEAYRWFLSSEGFLVIGGRDAKTNDAVVKKHLKEGDRYVHADIHGAPSCVVKEGSKAGEPTLAEACAFALAWSKAWSAGLASGSAFWVTPDQVSKQAESGEYVSRGAFVIRGKRNYVHDIPVRAAVGEIEHEGHRKVMAGPVPALAARSTRYGVLEPGEEDKQALARRIAH